MTATRNNLKSVSVFGNSVNSLSPGKETIISLSRSRLSVKKLLPRKWLKNRLFWAKSGHFARALRDVFLGFCSRAEPFPVKKLWASKKPIKKLWDSTVHIFRIYAFAESAYLGGFESLSRGFEEVFALKSISKTRKTLKKLSEAEIVVNSVSLPRIHINSMSEKTGAVKSGRQRITVGRYRLIVTGDDGKYRNQPSLLSQPSLPTQTGKTKNQKRDYCHTGKAVFYDGCDGNDRRFYERE